MIQDYDCFYAAVFENENPALKHLPLAVQQKQIIVTCNYEARRRGLYKLQLIREAKRVCPDVIIVLGEDLTRFRNASKDLYNFLKVFVWSQKAERLGFDEVFLDVTSMIEYNVELLNKNDLAHSFFHLDKEDPTIGFAYDATSVYGHTYPKKLTASTVRSPEPRKYDESEGLMLRLHLGSHLAQHLRHQLEEQKGYTATVGISTNKLLSKLVGNVHKPNDQTTLMPPYTLPDGEATHVTNFIDDHDIGKIPGIGFKLAQKIRHYVLGKAAKFDDGLVYGGTLENVKAGNVRLYHQMGPETLESILGGHGSPRGIGSKVWGLINGIDDTEVGVARSVPRQISIEDSYIRLDTMEEVVKELRMLAMSLLKRMRLDLIETDDDNQGLDMEESTDQGLQANESRQWLAHPKTLRLTTRPRPPLNADGTRTRSFNRISRSGPMPTWILNLNENIEDLAIRLVNEALIPSFRKLHPEKSGWNLSLVNVAATNMVETAADDKFGSGRDIGKMFRRQEDVLKPWKVEDRDIAPSDEDEGDIGTDTAFPDQEKVLSVEAEAAPNAIATTTPFEPQPKIEAVSSPEDGSWESDDEYDAEVGETCAACGATMPAFAIAAHQRFHLDPD